MIPKFIKKIATLGFLWATAVYGVCLLLPFHYFNSEYPMWVSKMEKLNEKDFNRNYILGDSRAIAGLDPKLLGENYYNLALGGGTPMEGYFMLKKMLEAGKKVDTLIISYAPIHLEQSEMFWDRQLKYNFYDLNDIDFIFNELNVENESFWTYNKAEFFSEGEKTSLLTKAYAVHFKNPMELRPELTKSFLLRGYANYKVYHDIKNKKGSYDFGTLPGSNDLNVEAKREYFKPKKILTHCLEKTFQLAQRNNIKVVCLSLPMNDTSFRSLSKPYREGVLRLYQDLQNKYPETLFYDTGLVTYEDTFFGDGSHLNKTGRQKFSTEIRSQLKTYHPNRLNNLVTAIK